MTEEEDSRTAPSRSGGLDPRVEAWLRQTEEQEAVGAEVLGPIKLREAADVAARELLGTPDPVARIENLSIAGPAVHVPVRIFTPEGTAPFPILVYFHGGGWMFCSIDTHDSVCRTIANRAGCVVVSVDYRLAPEQRFPAAVEDTYAATVWAANNLARLGGAPDRIAVGGDSSGGNLAAAVCLMARDRGQPSLSYQVLINPAMNLASCDTDSYRDFESGYGLRKAAVMWYRDQYLGKEEDRYHPYASPLLAHDFSDLPPAFVITSEYDVLRDEGEDYVRRLNEAGVPAAYARCSGMIHFGFHWAVATDIAAHAIDMAAAAIRSAFRERRPHSRPTTTLQGC